MKRAVISAAVLLCSGCTYGAVDVVSSNGTIEPAPVSEPELKLAQQLIDHLAAKRFDPNEYQDEFKGRVETAIQKKVEGKQISLAEAPTASTSGNVIDLMAALRASIDARGSKDSAALKERKAPKRAASAGAARKTARR